MAHQYTFLIITIFNAFVQTDNVHKIWLFGRYTSVSCELDADLLHTVNYRKNNQSSSPVLALTIWYGKSNQLVNIGQKSVIYLPTISASQELFPVRSSLRSSPISRTNRDIFTGHTEWDQLMGWFQSESIICHVARPLTMEGIHQENWNFDNRPLDILQTKQFSLHMYIRPEISWTYRFKSTSNLDTIIAEIVKWCSEKPTIGTLKPFNPCQHVFDRKMSDSIKELVIVADLPNEIWTTNPMDEETTLNHALLKFHLDKIVTKASYAHDQSLSNIPNMVRAICTPGSQPFAPIPKLKALNHETDKESTNSSHLPTNSSASALSKWPLLCKPCGPGKAPKVPYSFNNCYPCPRGFYMAQEFGWPHNYGCVRCPQGFTTDKTGSLSKAECHIDAGLIMSPIISHLYQMEDALDHLLNLRESLENWNWHDQSCLIILIIALIYLLVVIWLFSVAIYRLMLYHLLKNRYNLQFRTLLRATVVGQLNLMNRLKNRDKNGNTKKHDKVKK